MYGPISTEVGLMSTNFDLTNLLFYLIRPDVDQVGKIPMDPARHFLGQPCHFGKNMQRAGRNPVVRTPQIVPRSMDATTTHGCGLSATNNLLRNTPARHR